MKVLSIVLGLVILIGFFSQGVYAKPCATKEDVETLVNGNNEFAFSLYTKLSEKTQGDNLFFSPFSISSALSMAYVGANGDTKEQMKEVLHFDLPDEDIYKAFRALFDELCYNKKGYILEIANALWGEKGYKFLESFLNIIKTYYNGGFHEVSFSMDPEGSRRNINKWVKDVTRGKIKNLLPPGSINTLTRLVITNAIYFKGKWTYPFLKNATESMPFYLNEENTVDVPMMYQKRKFHYFEKRGKYQLVELPYGDGTLSMVIILPIEKDGLTELERELTWDEVSNAIVRTRKMEVKLFLPRFKMERAYSLVESLKSLGMVDAFDISRADFSKMEPKKELYITAIMHKAYIDVNEEGTEAAAATGVVVGLKAMRISEPIVFRADHPFLYMIIHNPTGQILFMGRVINPEK